MLFDASVSLMKTGLIHTPEGKTLMDKINTNFNHRRYSNNQGSSLVILVTKEEIDKVLSLPPVYNLDSGNTYFQSTNSYARHIKDLNKLNGISPTIKIYSPDGSLLHTFSKPSEALRKLDMSKTTFYRYLNSGRIYNNKYKIVSVS